MPSRLFVRSSLLALALLTATPASASDVSLLAGIGARFEAGGAGEVNTIGVLHASYAPVDMLLIAAELHGYIAGRGVSGMDFADAQVGLLFDAPIPGWFGVEAGVHIGVSQLLKARHGADRIVGMLKPEIALTGEIGVFKARLSYQHNLIPLGNTTGVNIRDGQVTATAGLTF